MPDKALMQRNAELQAALTKLRAEVALTQETLQAARLCSMSTIEILSRMRTALEDIRRRTGPESVLAQSVIKNTEYDEVAEIHQVADTALQDVAATREQFAQRA